MESEVNKLLNLLGQSWDEWDPPIPTTEYEEHLERNGHQAKSFPNLQDCNTLELGTLPSSLMPLFGSYPIDDVLSLTTCHNCQFRFRTQTIDYHTKNCLRNHNQKSSSVLRPLAAVEKGAKVAPATTKPKPGTNQVVVKEEILDNALQRALSQPPKVVVPNLVPPLIIKREPTTDMDTAPTYTTQAIKVETEVVKPTFPASLDFTLENRIYPEPTTSIPKKVQESREKKMIPLKDRHFNPEEHCGVPSEIDGRPCTRSLTCKTHSIALRRNVEGRSKCFDLLLASHKKSRDKAKLEGNGFKDVRLSIDSPKPPLVMFPATLPDISTPRSDPISRFETADNFGHLEITKYSTPNCDRKYLASVNTRLPITSLKIDRQLGQEEKVLAFNSLASNDLVLGRDNYAYFSQERNNEEMDTSDDFEEECWTALPLERVKVPRPPQKSIKKNGFLEQWRNGKINQLELLEQGISIYKGLTNERDEKSLKKESPNPKRMCTPPQNPIDSANHMNGVQGTLYPSNQRHTPFKISRNMGKYNSNSTIWQQQQQDSGHHTPDKYQTSTRISPKTKANVPGLSGILQMGANEQTYKTSLFTGKTQATASKLMEAITSADGQISERNENMYETIPPGVKCFRDKDGRMRIINKSATTTTISGEPRPSWVKNTSDIAAGTGQRSPHDGPVSDSELNNLLAAQFEDLDF